MPTKTKEYYIQKQEFHDALVECIATGQPTVRVCKLFRLLISRFLSGPRWSGYQSLIPDLESACLLKCLKNVKNYRAERSNPFGYYTLACECACKDFLRTFHYKQINIKRDLREMGGINEPVHEEVGEIGP